MANERLTEAQRARLRAEPSVWLATVKPDSTAHLVPVWAVLHADDRLFIGTMGTAQKVRNVAAHGSAAVALPDPDSPIIVEGAATVMAVAEAPPEVLAAFRAKYDWDVATDPGYLLLVVEPRKVLAWG